jgi:hypothetical protein
MFPMLFGILWTCWRYVELRKKYLFLASWNFKFIVLPVTLLLSVFIVEFVNSILAG